MKIIILDHEPYSKRREEHFCIKEFRDKGVEVEFWCVWKILPYTKNLIYNYKEEGDGVFYLESKKTLKARLNELDNKSTFVFAEFLLNSDTLFIYILLQHQCLKWGCLDYYYNPVVNFYTSQRKPFANNILTKIRNAFWKLLNYEYLKFQIISKIKTRYFKSIITSDISFITGANRRNLNPSAKIVSIDYFDIEKYNSEIKNTPLIDYPYIVFADVYLGKHPDLQIKNPKQYMDVEAYYRRLNAFFSLLEDKLEMPVVIAAHPKSSYNREFNGRLCIKNETANLIINSKLMIQHCSLSVTFALLSEKKIIQFYDNEFLVNPALSNFYETMWAVTKQTDSVCINIEEDFNIRDIFVSDFNVDRYREILEMYFLKDIREERSNFEIIHENIKCLFV